MSKLREKFGETLLEALHREVREESRSKHA